VEPEGRGSLGPWPGGSQASSLYTVQGDSQGSLGSMTDLLRTPAREPLWPGGPAPPRHCLPLDLVAGHLPPPRPAPRPARPPPWGPGTGYTAPGRHARLPPHTALPPPQHFHLSQL
jgi:hypothetical protein